MSSSLPRGDAEKKLLEHVRIQEREIRTEIDKIRRNSEDFAGRGQRFETLILIVGTLTAGLSTILLSNSLRITFSTEQLSIIVALITAGFGGLSAFYFWQLKRSQNEIFEMDKLLETYLSLDSRLELIAEAPQYMTISFEALAAKVEDIDKTYKEIRSKSSGRQ